MTWKYLLYFYVHSYLETGTKHLKIFYSSKTAKLNTYILFIIYKISAMLIWVNTVVYLFNVYLK